MQVSVQVENQSPVVRKLKIRVPAAEVAARFERGLNEVQKTANLKGFRPGQVPMSVVRQQYGEDVRHRLFHNLIDESFQIAVRDQKIKAVGRPQIDAGGHQHGHGEHDHAIHEDKDLEYTATVEVMPEIKVSGYTGLSLSRDKIEVSDEQVSKVVEGLRDSQAELIPASSGIVMGDGAQSSRPVIMGDYVDLEFDGGLVAGDTVEPQEGMKGARMIEIGSNSLIPGFEEQVVGMRRGDKKTFRIDFPKDYHESTIAGKQAEFKVQVNEVKEKKMPELNDDFAKQAGYEGLDDLRAKAREFLSREAAENSARKLRSDLLGAIIEKNTFDVPGSLVEAQTRSLAQDWAQELKNQGASEDVIQSAIQSEIEGLKKRAESQVRASLLLETIGEKENVAVTDQEISVEMDKLAASMKVERPKLEEFYDKNPSRRGDLEFRMRQEKVVQFLLDSAKIKNA